MDYGIDMIYLIKQLIFMIISIPSIESSNNDTCNSRTERKAICKDQTLDVMCENGTVIHIQYANFGRIDDTKSCSEYLGIETVNCDNSQKTMQILYKYCRQQQKCSIKVSEEIFGNPCYVVTEFLIVDYKCLPVSCFHEATVQTEQSTFEEATTNTFTFSPSLSITSNYPIELIFHQTETTSTTNVTNENETILITEGYIISGAVLGVSGFVFLAIIIIIVRKRLCSNKSSKQKSRTQDDIELREQLQHNSQYEDPNQYNDPSPQSSNTAANETIPLNEKHVNTPVDEGAYDVSLNKKLSKPHENESEYDTHFTVPDDTYDESVTSAQRKATSDDVNNTYDHFFQQQDENEYDLSSNPLKMIKDNQDMYS